MNYKKFGYTHKIHYLKYVEFFKMDLEHSFPTTEDMVNRHVEALNRSNIVSKVWVEVL